VDFFQPLDLVLFQLQFHLAFEPATRAALLAVVTTDPPEDKFLRLGVFLIRNINQTARDR